MNIKFYSHACFSVENDNTLLLNDPYLSGTAFNDGWDLIVNDVVFNRFSEKSLFIYYSHEHPDHFSIPFLKSVEMQIREKITIIFQKTRDGRVKSFLENEGFSVIEVDDKKRVEISEEFFITVGQVPFYDSWALIEVNGKKILNANDEEREQFLRQKTEPNFPGKFYAGLNGTSAHHQCKKSSQELGGWRWQDD